jgi:hypothetical protein
MATDTAYLLGDLLSLQVEMLELLKPSLWKPGEFPPEFAARCGVLFEQSLKLLGPAAVLMVVLEHVKELEDMGIDIQRGRVVVR